MFIIIPLLVLGLTVTATFGLLTSFGASGSVALVVILFSLFAAFVMGQALNWTIVRTFINQKVPETGVSEWEQKSKIRWVNRKSFWSKILTLTIIIIVGYFFAVGIPYLLFGVTVGDIKSFFTTNPSGQAMAFQFLGIMPMWLILPFIYLFAFYGPFFLKVWFFDMKVIEPGSTKIKIKREDIVGQDEVLEELEKKLRALMDREQLRKMGIRPDRGVLIVGPPGTGKTLTLKYLADTFGFAFIQIYSTIARQTFVGVAIIAMWLAQWRTVRLARKWDGALALIDEVDVLASRRSGMEGNLPSGGFSRFISPMIFGGQDDSAIVVLMTWMDGMDTSSPFLYGLIRGTVNTILDATFVDEYILLPIWNILIVQNVNLFLSLLRLPSRIRLPHLQEPPRFPAWQVSGDDKVFFIGTTNRPQVLDPAITRHGRFAPVLLYYDLPNEEGRDAYIKYLLKKYPHVSELDSQEQRSIVVRGTEGLAQANILFVFNAAYVSKRDSARRQNRDIPDQEIKIDLVDIMESRDMLRHGIAKLPQPSLLHDRRRVALHESGHFIAVRGGLRERVIPVHLSALRRGRSLGRVESLTVVPVDVHPQRFIVGWLRVACASHATERRFFGESTIGVMGDLAIATLLAVEMVELWGMSPYKCSDEDRKKYQAIGSRIASWQYAQQIAQQNHIEYSPWLRTINEDAYLNPRFAGQFINNVLAQTNKKADVEVILGQAYVFCDLLVKNNMPVIEAVARRLEEADWEIRGNALKELYQELGEGGSLAITIPASPASPDDWPELDLSDPFYQNRESMEVGDES